MKKAKKRRKIVSARKASAPKNKARRENEDAGEGAETSTDGEEDDKGEEEEEEDEEEDEAESVAGPSRLPTPPNFEINGDVEMGEPTMSRGVPVDEIDPEVAEREQRRREKREKREKRDHKRKSRQDEAMTAPGEPVEASEPIDPTDPTDLTSPTAPTREEDDSRPKRPSPPPLEAFPLPRPAPAPDPKILARQGLPLGLSDAVFIDQDLRIPVSELLITRRGTVEKGVGERMGKRLAEIGVEDFFAGSLCSLLVTQGCS